MHMACVMFKAQSHQDCHGTMMVTQRDEARSSHMTFCIESDPMCSVRYTVTFYAVSAGRCSCRVCLDQMWSHIAPLSPIPFARPSLLPPTRVCCPSAPSPCHRHMPQRAGSRPRAWPVFDAFTTLHTLL